MTMMMMRKMTVMEASQCLLEGFKYYHFDFIRLNIFAQMNSIISEAQ